MFTEPQALNHFKLEVQDLLNHKALNHFKLEVQEETRKTRGRDKGIHCTIPQSWPAGCRRSRAVPRWCAGVGARLLELSSTARSGSAVGRGRVRPTHRAYLAEWRLPRQVAARRRA
jgi:hypothetical protein